MWRKESSAHCWWECRSVQPLWRFLQKLKMVLPYDPAIPLLCFHHPKNQKTLIQNNVCTAIFIAAQFTIAKKKKHPKCPTKDDWIQKLWYISTMEYYSAIKKDEMLPITTPWMELETCMLSDVSQPEKDKTHMSSLTCGN